MDGPTIMAMTGLLILTGAVCFGWGRACGWVDGYARGRQDERQRWAREVGRG